MPICPRFCFCPLIPLKVSARQRRILSGILLFTLIKVCIVLPVRQQLNVFFGPNQCCFPRSDLSGKFFKGCGQRSVLFVSTAGAAGTKNKLGQDLFCRIWLTRRQATVLMMSSCSMEILIFRIPRNTMRTRIHHRIVHCTLYTYICNPGEWH